MQRRHFLGLLAGATATLALPSVKRKRIPMKYARLNLDATFMSGFPAQPWLTNVVYHSAGELLFQPNPLQPAVALYWHRIDYQVLGTRWKRCFVIAPSSIPPHVNSAGTVIQGTKPIMVVALPGSNNNSDGDNNGLNDGAWDLTEDIGENEIQYRWPLHLVKDHNVFAVLIDGPLFGAYPYHPNLTPADAANLLSPVDSLVDDICGVEAAHYFLNEMPIFPIYGVHPPLGKHIFVGGLSWGAVRAEFLTAALRDCQVGYIAGGMMDNYDPRPVFNPPDWATLGKDYPDMLKAANAKKIRIQYGGANTDYMRFPFLPGIDSTIDSLVSYDPVKFSKQISPGLGHQIDLADLKSYFAANLGTLLYSLPKYDPAD